jgi:hypothetical protein
MPSNSSSASAAGAGIGSEAAVGDIDESDMMMMDAWFDCVHVTHAFVIE